MFQNNCIHNISHTLGKGGCFIPGTKVTCTDGSELVIEKQTDGIKLLAIGGETTTITQEYVRERMEAGEKLFGINDDTPFAALHHPFWTTDGWKSLDPEFAKQENPTVDFKLLQVGDVVFRIAQINPLLYEPVKIRQFTFTTLEQPIMIYGLHLDGPRSYHANGYVVAANYPVLTKKRVSDGLKKLTEEEKERLVSSMTAAQSELSKVLGSWADQAFKDMGLVSKDLSQADGYHDCI